MDEYRATRGCGDSSTQHQGGSHQHPMTPKTQVKKEPGPHDSRNKRHSMQMCAAEKSKKKSNDNQNWRVSSRIPQR